MNSIAEFSTAAPDSLPRKAMPWLRHLTLAAVILAAAGQYILFRTNGDQPNEATMQALGGGLLILGALLFAFGVQWLQQPNRPAMADMAPEAPGPIALQWVPALLAAFVAGLLALAIFVHNGENAVVVVLWIVGIVMLVASQLRGVRLRWPHIDRNEWPYLGGLLLCLLVAAAMRTYHLDTLPYNIDGDFASVGNQASALVAGEQRDLFAYGWATVPILGYLPPWITMSLFGTGLTGLNASGVAEGLLIILGVYVLGRELLSARAAMFAAAILTVSYTHLAASRQPSYIDPAFFMLFATNFLVVGLRKGQGWMVVISSLLTALCLEMYFSGRLIIPFAGSALLYALIFGRPWLRSHWKPLLTWLAGVLIALGPMLAVFVGSPTDLSSRMEQVSILNPATMTHMQGVYGVTTMTDVLLQQARHTALLFNYYPDRSTQYGLRMPFLDPFSGVLFALGLGSLLFAWKRLGAWALLWWTLLGMVLGSFLTGNAPFWPRLMILLPPVGLICGVTLDLLYGYVTSNLRKGNLPIRVVLSLLLVLAFVAVGVQNWRAYLEVKGTFATPRTRIGRYLADQPKEARAYLVSNDFGYHDREFDFLAPGRLVANLVPAQLDSPIPQIGSPTLLIVTPEQTGLIQQLQEQYVGGPIPGNSPGEIAFYAFRLP